MPHAHLAACIRTAFGHYQRRRVRSSTTAFGSRLLTVSSSQLEKRNRFLHHPAPRSPRVDSARQLKRPGRPSSVTTEATKGSIGRSKRTLTLSLGTVSGCDTSACHTVHCTYPMLHHQLYTQKTRCGPLRPWLLTGALVNGLMPEALAQLQPSALIVIGDPTSSAACLGKTSTTVGGTGRTVSGLGEA